jgi:hypothetical protein
MIRWRDARSGPETHSKTMQEISVCMCTGKQAHVNIIVYDLETLRLFLIVVDFDSLEQLERARTHDELWNAAQQEMVHRCCVWLHVFVRRHSKL